MLEKIEKLLWKNAHAYATGALEPEDLFNEQVCLVLKMQEEDSRAKLPFFPRLVVRSCRNACINLYHKEKLRGSGLCFDDVEPVLTGLSDNSYEEYRKKLEFNERVSLLRGLDKAVAEEIINPSLPTQKAIQEEEDAVFEMILEGKDVRSRPGIDQTARHIARGLKLPLNRVKNSCRNLKHEFTY